MTQAGSKPTIPASKWQQTNALERVATGMDSKLRTVIKYWTQNNLKLDKY